MRGSRLKKWTGALLLACLLMVLLPGVAAAISLDGSFDDWAGQPNIPDPVGDGPTNNTDLTAFYWTLGAGQDVIYFMFERVGANGPVYFAVNIDCNNNGSFGDAEDRRVVAHYHPKNDAGPVSVSVLTGQGAPVGGSGGDWGETKGEGGSRAELMVSLQDLGIDTHQVISMVALAAQNSGLGNADLGPDGGTITWTPIPIAGWLALGLAIVAIIGIVWYRKGRFVWRPTSPSAS